MNFCDLLNEQKNVFADKIYTKPSVALECIKKLNIKKYDRIIEPSAGSGAFSKQIPNCEAYDLYPEDKSIKQQDFLKFKTEKGNILVIGNPPFGANCELAIKFINHAATFAKTIAFVLPAAFGRPSIINKLDKNIHLRKVYDLKPRSFEISGKPAEVNCVYCIFDVLKKDRQETEHKIYRTNDFSFCPHSQANFWIIRKGYNVGKPIPEDSPISYASRSFIKSNIDVKELESRFLSLKNDFRQEAKYAIGAPYLSQEQFLKIYTRKFGEA